MYTYFGLVNFCNYLLILHFPCRTVLNAEKHSADSDTSMAALIFGSFGNFLLMFLGSAIIGVVFALISALVGYFERESH